MNNSQQQSGWKKLVLSRRWGVAVMGMGMLLSSACVGLTPQTGQPRAGGEMVIMQSGGGEGDRGMVELKGAKLLPAAGMPTTPPDVAGLFQSRQDQSLFIGTGEIEMQISVPKEGGDPVIKASSNGPTVEVVVNRNTTIYKDTTEISLEARRDGLEVQQTVELYDSLDQLTEEISTTDELSVWGRKSGDRLIAETVVYRAFSPPAMPGR